MNGQLKAYLVLGCNGCRSKDFFLCPGVENIILDLENLEEDKYHKTIDFLDSACDLFNSVANDHNKCVNILSMLYRTYYAYDSKMLNNIQNFIKMHKDCGIWLMLILKKDYKNE